jgi:hypothetical protein
MKDRTDSASNINPDINPNHHNSDINSENIILENDKQELNGASLSLLSSESPESPGLKRTTVTKNNTGRRISFSQSQLILIALLLMALGLWFKLSWLGLTSAITALCLSLGVVFSSVRGWVIKFLTIQERRTILAFIGFVGAIAQIFRIL